MNLTGSIKEIQRLLLAAEKLKSQAIYFAAPNKVVILSDDKEDYVYLNTTIRITSSFMIPSKGYENIRRYLRAAKKDTKKVFSRFYKQDLQTVSISKDHMIFNEDEALLVEVTQIAAPMKLDAGMKMDTAFQSSFSPDVPYLRLDREMFTYLFKEMTLYKNGFQNRTSSDNAIRIEDFQLVFYYTYHENPARIETGITEYGFHNSVDDRILIPDRCIYLSYWLMAVSGIEHMIFLPRDGFCLAEGHGEQMHIKIGARSQNDPLIDKV